MKYKLGTLFACSAAVTLIGATPVTTHAAATRTKMVEIQPQTNKVEQEFGRLVNNERARLHRRQLKRIPAGDLLAKRRAPELVRRFEHKRPGTNLWITEQAYLWNRKYYVFAENICSTHVFTKTVSEESRASEQTKMNNGLAKQIYTAFRNSRGHYQNFTDKNYSGQGIGVYRKPGWASYRGCIKYEICHLFHWNLTGYNNTRGWDVRQTLTLR